MLLGLLKRLLYKLHLRQRPELGWLRKLHGIRTEADVLLRAANQDSYCARRIEFNEIEKLAAHWEEIEPNHRYLESVLTHEFLDNNIHLTEREREVARDCVKLVGDFYNRARKEAHFVNLTNKKHVNTLASEVKYRRD